MTVIDSERFYYRSSHTFSVKRKPILRTALSIHSRRGERGETKTEGRGKLTINEAYWNCFLLEILYIIDNSLQCTLSCVQLKLC